MTDAPPTSPPPAAEKELETQDEMEDQEEDAVPPMAPPRTARSPVYSQVQQQLRQRRGLRTSLGGASSPLNDSGVPTSLARPRRASSFRSTGSADSRPSLQSTGADSFFVPTAQSAHEDLHADHEPTLWHSAPLLLAVVPAIGGVAFQKGSVIITDLALLFLAAIYLNWCLITPWTWYREARRVHVVSDSPEEAVAEADELADSAKSVANDVTDGAAATDDEGAGAPSPTDAQRELAMHELAALACCFAGPLMGAWLLHTLRTSLSSFGDELVSNMHLSLFVLGAELRPMRHAIKLVQARTLYLQRRVRADPSAMPAATPAPDDLPDLRARLDELETAVADAAANAKPPVADDGSSAKAQATLQTQVDALTRAVRRYEKRATAQALQTEAQLHELEARVRDALALAAAAAQFSRKPGVGEWALRAARMPFAAAYTLVLVPFEAIVRMLVRALERMGFVRQTERRRVAKRGAAVPIRGAKDAQRMRGEKAGAFR